MCAPEPAAANNSIWKEREMRIAMFNDQRIGVVADDDVEFTDRSAIKLCAPNPNEGKCRVPRVRRFQTGDPSGEVLRGLWQGCRCAELQVAARRPWQRGECIAKRDERFPLVQCFAIRARPTRGDDIRWYV